MTFIEPITEAEIWLLSRLKNDTGVQTTFGTRVSTHPSPRTWTYPVLTYFCLTPQDNLMVVGGDIFWSTLRFLVRGIVQGDDHMALRNGIAAVQGALHKQRGETSNAFIESCIQIRPFSMTEMADSIQFYHLGGEYQIRVRAKD